MVIDLCNNGLLDTYVNDDLNICSCTMNGSRFLLSERFDQ